MHHRSCRTYPVNTSLAPAGLTPAMPPLALPYCDAVLCYRNHAGCCAQARRLRWRKGRLLQIRDGEPRTFCEPAAVDAILQQVQQRRPDRGQRAAALLEWPAGDVEACGVRTLMIGCWTCLMNDVSGDRLVRLLTKPWADFSGPVRPRQLDLAGRGPAD